MSKNKEIIQKDEVIQAVLVADNFNDAFTPITNEIPLILMPLANKPLIEYSLEFLALGGIQETYLFCSSHTEEIKKYIKNAVNNNATWSQTMQINIIVSESCRSLGDCLRDLDAKGLIRNNFVLLEAGGIANLKLLTLIKKHNEITKKDKGCAMTLIYQQAGLGQQGYCPQEQVLLGINSNGRVFFRKYMEMERNKKINFPLDMFLENSNLSIRHDLKDTHVAICSPTVLPLFSDNFDYQTRDDFVKGLLMVDEVLDSTIYSHIIEGAEHGGAVTNWRMYQAISNELMERWFFPVEPSIKKTRNYGKNVALGDGCNISDNAKLTRCIIGNNVKIGAKTILEDCFIFSDSIIGDNCQLTHSVIGQNARIQNACKITNGCVIGNNVILEKNTKVDNALVQDKHSDEYESCNKLSSKAFSIKLDDDLNGISMKINRLRIEDDCVSSDGDDDVESTDSEDELSQTMSPIPDDTNMFLTEVIDSLARGFEDKLQCDNLILEINSSRYAYNVTLKEVNYNVVKAILNLPFQQSNGQQYFQALSRCLVYFSPILKNYLRNEDAMHDCLQAIEDVAASNNELNECIVKILNWFYDKDHISEESILLWFSKLDRTGRMYARAAPFIKWLQEAEEATSSEESE